MTFPTASSSVYYNEDGEVLGWDSGLDYEPEYGNYYSDEPVWDDEPDVWGDQESCEAYGYHGQSGEAVTGRTDVWECAACGGYYPREYDPEDDLGTWE